MSWSNILNIFSGRTPPTLTHQPLVGVTPVSKNVPLVHAPANIRMVHIDQIPGMLDATKKLNVSLLKEGCRICNIPFVGGGIVFCKASPNPDIELDNLKIAMVKMLGSKGEYVFTYFKEERNHPTLAYYSILGIRGDDVLQLKKALKIHKLKAFL